MAYAVIMPRQGQSVESCIITQWHKKQGDEIHEGDILFSYETDKAAFEETAKSSGKLLAVFYQEDDDVLCLNTVAVIGEDGEDISSFALEDAGISPISSNPVDHSVESRHEVAAVDGGEKQSLLSMHQQRPCSSDIAGISPRARQTAQRLGVNASLANPSGPNGRVIERDILSLAHSGTGDGHAESLPANTGEYEAVKLSGVRKAIAKGMLLSLQTIAQLTNHCSFDASTIISLRKQYKVKHENEGAPNITLNDMIMFACSRALLNHKDLNAHLANNEIRRFTHVHLGIAVDTPRGLLVPTLFNADMLNLAEIAVKSKELAAMAQSGAIAPDLLTGATFTITNLGSLDVEQFTPVINPPQTGILGVGSIVERVRLSNKGIEVYPYMGLSLTYDHRAVDGAPAARFVQELREMLESMTQNTF